MVSVSSASVASHSSGDAACAASTASAASAAAAPPSKPTKRVRFDDISGVQVAEFNTANPAAVLGTADADFAAIDRAEHAALLRNRRRKAQLPLPPATDVPSLPASTSPSVATTAAAVFGGTRQAFSLFAIPIVVDTRALSAAELRAELRARSLRLDGDKARLAARLDAYVLAHERDRARPDLPAAGSTVSPASVSVSSSPPAAVSPPPPPPLGSSLRVAPVAAVSVAAPQTPANDGHGSETHPPAAKRGRNEAAAALFSAKPQRTSRRKAG